MASIAVSETYIWKQFLSKVNGAWSRAASFLLPQGQLPICYLFGSQVVGGDFW